MLAWNLKAWAALLVPEVPRHASKHRAEKQTLLRMEFKTFCAVMIEMPCQIVQGSRRLVYRLLSWNPWQVRLLETRRTAQQRLAVLTVATLKPGSGCPGPCRLPDRKLGETPRDMSDGQTMLVIPRHRGCSVSAHFADREKSGVISRLV